MSNPYRDKLLSVGVVDRKSLSRPRVKAGRGENGAYKAVTDEFNNTCTYHVEGDRKDVHLRPTTIEGAF